MRILLHIPPPYSSYALLPVHSPYAFLMDCYNDRSKGYQWYQKETRDWCYPFEETGDTVWEKGLLRKNNRRYWITHGKRRKEPQ
jgi:hypothetical protein